MESGQSLCYLQVGELRKRFGEANGTVFKCRRSRPRSRRFLRGLRNLTGVMRNLRGMALKEPKAVEGDRLAAPCLAAPFPARG